MGFIEDGWLCSFNAIYKNTISSNGIGICLDEASKNKIFENNFINNSQSAYFMRSRNKWFRNYWDKPRILPKLIIGTIKTGSKWIPWINIDWRPALKPYDIEV